MPLRLWLRRGYAPGRPRRGVGAALALGVVVMLAAAPAASAQSAARGPGRRITVGLFGDSVTEGIVIPHFATVGLAAQLTAAETREGFSPGGEGLIAANQYQWHFNAYGIYGLQKTPPDGWALVGAQDQSHVQPGVDGPSGYSAETASQTATASTIVSDPDIEVLYTTSLIPCRFRVTVGARTWTIDSFRPGITAVAAEAPISVGPGRHRLVVHGSSCGGLIFDGVVAQRPVAPGTTQIQFDNDGHAARVPSTDLSTRVEEAILEQHYRLSVFLYGYIGEIVLGPGASARQYEQALLTRARLARLNGGACLIVEPAPLPVPDSQVRLVSGIERTVARAAGCTYSTALAHLWPSPNVAINRGLVVLDGIHPTAAGYRLMARALAPVIAHLVRG